MKKGSEIPKIEFEITLGSRIKNPAPIKEMTLGKNFLHKKYIGKQISLNPAGYVCVCVCVFFVRNSSPRTANKLNRVI